MKEEVSRPQQTQQRLAVLIDADNISAALAGEIFKKVYAIGMPIARRAYGMINCFASDSKFIMCLYNYNQYGQMSKETNNYYIGVFRQDLTKIIEYMLNDYIMYDLEFNFLFFQNVFI